MKNLIVTVLVLALAGAGWLAWSWTRRPEPPDAMRVAEVERGTLRLSVSSTGRVISNLDVDIKCKASGEVTTLPFDVSDPVRKGELLVALDPVDEERVVKQAEVALSASKARQIIAKQNLDIATLTLETDRKRADATVKAADAQARNAHAQADRQERLSRTSSGMAADRDAAVAAAAKADADLEIARIQQDEIKTQALGIELRRQELALADAAVESDNITRSIARDRLTDTKVFAPIDGVVALRKVEKGQIISSGITSIAGGTTVLMLSDLSRIFVIADVDESDIGEVCVGQAASITADAFPGRTFEGRVIRIATRGVNVSNVVTFEVKIEVLSEAKSLLKPEMTANIDITMKTRENVLMVPVEAVVRRGGETSVLVPDGPEPGRAPSERAVKIGMTDGVKLEVTEGLKEGEKVVYAKAPPESRWNASVRPIYIPGGPRKK